MIDVILDGLPDFVNNGDIVEVLTREVQIDGSKIGKIRINRRRRRALIEVDEEVVQIVVEGMNGRQISGAEIKVSVKNYDEYLRINIRNYTTRFKNLLYLDRQEKLVKHRLEMRYLSGEEREKKGHALLKMRGRANSFPENNCYSVRFTFQDGESLLPEHKFTIGDLVIVSKGDPLTEGNIQGRVVDVEPTALTVEFKGEPPYFVYGRGLRLDLYGNDRIFQQTLKTLKLLYLQDRSIPCRLREILIGEEEPEWSGWKVIVEDHGYLDEEQQAALYKALKARDLLVIQGGPGTGKTMLGAEIIRHHLKRGFTTLAVGGSPKSRDILANQLERIGLKVLKLDDMDLKVEEGYDQIYSSIAEVKELMKRRDELTHPGGPWMEGLTYKDIIDKAGNVFRYAGIPGYRLKEMAEWIQLQRKIDQIMNYVRSVQNKIRAKLMAQHDVLCISFDEVAYLNDEFDLILIDDAHMVNEPEILPVFFNGQKVIMIGDKNQIPPMVESPEAKEGGLAKSLFVRFLEELDGEWICKLDTQHRFNYGFWTCLNPIVEIGEKIESLRNDNTISLNKWRYGPSKEILEYSESVIFIDTSGINIEEVKVDDEFINFFEVDLIREFLQVGFDIMEMKEKVGIITFYQAQVKAIKDILHLNNINFDCVLTVDEFCGEEKDLIIISLVHSNSEGYLNKVESIPHLLTAITRAREKCILIGNRKTLEVNSFYQELIKRIEQKGKVYVL